MAKRWPHHAAGPPPALLLLLLAAAGAFAQCGPGGTMPYPPGQSSCPQGPPGGGPGGPPGGGGGPGGGGQCMGGLGSCSAVATCEGPADGENCAADGSSNYVKRDLKWDAVMGIMKGTVTSNRCADHPYGVAAGDPGRQQRYHTAACTEQTFPDANFAAGAAAAPLRGTVGLSLSGGCNIYGPFEAGFTDGQVCAGGSCPAGLDVPVCENKLALECSTKAEELGMMLDDCAGHAMPYHYHVDLACNYDAQDSAPHSPAIGLALDGKLLHGKWEGGGRLASDVGLDACNGHYGTVPANEALGVTSVCVYHYHTSDTAPYTVGCFGPVGALDTCKKLYSSCGSGFEEITYDPDGTLTQPAITVNYDLDCPCFSQAADTGMCTMGPVGPVAPGPVPGPAPAETPPAAKLTQFDTDPSTGNGTAPKSNPVRDSSAGLRRAAWAALSATLLLVLA